MNVLAGVVVLTAALLTSFVFSTLAYALRDYSRAGLSDWFERRQRRNARDGRPEAADVRFPVGAEAAARADAVAEHEDELALGAGIVRTASNLIVVLTALDLVTHLMTPEAGPLTRYALAFALAFVLIAVFGVALPLATSSHAAEATIGRFAGLLRVKRVALWPVIRMHGPVDRAVRRATGRPAETSEHVEHEIEQEILDIVNEGREEGVIDEGERQMIERALRFQDVTVEQAMTPRSEITALHAGSTLADVLRVVCDTGFSRLPVYGETLDHVTGILVARDLFRFVGPDTADVGPFDLATLARPPMLVPESKRLADLLPDMQAQQIHMAVVLDEYGGTSGLVTIEDVIEELVGEIADEHEGDETPMFRVTDITGDAAEADARLGIDDVNRLMGLHLPENADYETLGGFVTKTLGRIPDVGDAFERETSDGGQAVFTVVAAEPHRVGRIHIERRAKPAAVPAEE